MALLGAVIKSSIERKRYVIDYSCWLAQDETVSDFVIAISPSTDPPLISDGAFASTDFLKLTSFLSQGKVGTFYTVAYVATTNQGQIKRDDLQVQVM